MTGTQGFKQVKDPRIFRLFRGDGLQGFLRAVSTFPLFFAAAAAHSRFAVPSAVAACFAVLITLYSASVYRKNREQFRAAVFLSVVFTYLSAVPFMLKLPYMALAGTVTLIYLMFLIGESGRIRQAADRPRPRSMPFSEARWSTAAIPLAIILGRVTGTADGAPGQLITAWSIGIPLFYLITVDGRLGRKAGPGLTGMLLLYFAVVSSSGIFLPGFGILVMFTVAYILREKKDRAENWSRRWEFILDHPGRILIASFLLLCTVGALLLSFSPAGTNDSIPVIDAAFTSVSAVCVTGLVVMDTGSDLNFWGQAVILLLIQAGGLGIMGISTLALHAIGRRLSLSQERIMASITHSDRMNIVDSLLLIVKYTFIMEGIGALLLSLFFLAGGENAAGSLWRGIFTSVSAFCNAGFALQTDSLMGYGGQPAVPVLTGILIIAGGLAPATALFVPDWIRGKNIPVPSRIALVTTAILLISGTVLFAALEWGGSLGGLSFGNRILHAWFQSVTARTAGFNSLDISSLSNPGYFLMMLLMFIGGSPGGTAGGIKTTTVAILALTFWANINNRNEQLVNNRRISAATVFRAVTIVTSGFLIWSIVVFMLETTQQLPARDLIFEATSALATVGLSTGATGGLDQIGKIIIMAAMFIGRVGPVTLFMILAPTGITGRSRSPEIHIPLT